MQSRFVRKHKHFNKLNKCVHSAMLFPHPKCPLFPSCLARASKSGKTGYPSDTPEIAELLRYQKDDDGRLRFLRKAQLEAIEVYFYLVLETGMCSSCTGSFSGTISLKRSAYPLLQKQSQIWLSTKAGKRSSKKSALIMSL